MKPVICWWSGGITSAVACHLAVKEFGVCNTRIVMIDTFNEHDDTYRFKKDCERIYKSQIENISAIPENYDSITDVWEEFLSLNVAHGAICSSELKRQVRVMFQKQNDYSYQIFGFDSSEAKRAENLLKNYPSSKPKFPLIERNISKKNCIEFFNSVGIEIPKAYKLGFQNNNCLGTGCVKGGVSYWNRYKREFPERFDKMAALEHKLSAIKGKPVTCLRDGSKKAIESGIRQVFLKNNPDFPDHKDITMMKGRKKDPLIECNGFCGTQTSLFETPELIGKD